MKKWTSLLLAIAAPFSQADDLSKTCLMNCSAGDKAVTYATKNDYYFACPTQELSEYISTTLGMASATYQITGKAPNISPKTGEPEFEGSAKDMIDSLRAAAGVSTYDEALKVCVKGKPKLLVTVMNSPADGGSIWVAGADKKPFWMPKIFLNKR